MLNFKLYPLTLLMKSHIVSYFYLCIWVNRCSIISQVIIHLKVLKLIVSVSILNLALFCSTVPVALLVVDLFPSQSFLLIRFAQHLEKLCLLLTCLDCLNLSCFVLLNTSSYSAHSQLVFVLLSQSFLLCFAEHLDSLCSLFSCLWQLSKYSCEVLVSFSPLWRSNLLLLMFHSHEILQYFDQ